MATAELVQFPLRKTHFFLRMLMHCVGRTSFHFLLGSGTADLCSRIGAPYFSLGFRLRSQGRSSPWAFMAKTAEGPGNSKPHASPGPFKVFHQWLVDNMNEIHWRASLHNYWTSLACSRNDVTIAQLLMDNHQTTSATEFLSLIWIETIQTKGLNIHTHVILLHE